jgi:hypothetical protein
VIHQNGKLSLLAEAIGRSKPPQRMPAYFEHWRLWWRMALCIMRREGVRRRVDRDAAHEFLLRAYQAAAMRQEPIE